MKTNYRLKGNQTLKIIGLSDTHIGSDQCNYEYLDYFFDTLKTIKGDYRILLGGDLLEIASKKIGNSSFMSQLDVNEQIRTITKYLKPYRKKIVVAITGNHESRLPKDWNFNPMQIIADNLECPLANQYFDNIIINDKPFTTYIRHGKGSSAYAHTAQGKTIRETQTIDANLYLEGHNHRLDFFSQPIRTGDGLKRKYYAFMGSFLSYNGYPDAMSLPLLPEAFQIITINKDHIVKNNPYYIDQTRPDLFKM